MAAHVGHIVDPGRASEHLPARHHHPTVGEAEPGVAGVGGIHPVRLRVQLQRRTGRRHQLRGGRRAPRFHQSHPASGILGEPSRDDRTGRPGTHDDKIKLFCHDSDPPPPATDRSAAQNAGTRSLHRLAQRAQIRHRSAPGNSSVAPEADAAARNDGSRASSGIGTTHRTRPPIVRTACDVTRNTARRFVAADIARDGQRCRCSALRPAEDRQLALETFDLVSLRTRTAPRHSSPKRRSG